MNRLERLALASKRQARKKIDLVDELLAIVGPPNGRALEIGCGAGFTSAHIATRYNMAVEGTDIDPDAIKVAGKKNAGARNIHFEIADAGLLPYQDSSFNLIVVQNVLHHVADWRKASDEAVRVLRPGGLFIVTDITGPSRVMIALTLASESHGFKEVGELIERMAARNVDLAFSKPQNGGREVAIVFRRQLET